MTERHCRRSDGSVLRREESAYGGRGGRLASVLLCRGAAYRMDFAGEEERHGMVSTGQWTLLIYQHTIGLEWSGFLYSKHFLSK